MSRTEYLALVPRDGLFCKDGRGWYTSASGRGHGLAWPWPSTILGALRFAWGCAHEAGTGSRFGPADWKARTKDVMLGRMVALRRGTDGTAELRPAWTEAHRMWPVPLDTLWLPSRQHVVYLDPVPTTVPTLGRDEDEARESLQMPDVNVLEKPLARPQWWSDQDLARWLAGEQISSTPEAWTVALPSRVQTHVGIEVQTGTADEGVLFSHDVLETLERDLEWAIGVEAQFPDDSSPAVARLGSDGRLVAIQSATENLFRPPERVVKAFHKSSLGLRLIAVSPASFPDGWLFDGFKRRRHEFWGRIAGVDGELILRAAFVARPAHVSGWDMAVNGGKGAPKPTSRTVPSGSVYYFERSDRRPFTEADVDALWLAPHGERTQEGFGRFVPGVWHPQRSTS